ncbi:uncharacterized protein LOC128671484 isoform X3 [Plodia interpunctella]|uniref:uncharacterized protein LOC128671484 isoform X3 n=1 Tax=Plodia interpunctella TaxID=58824 RepID=UPI0023675052|nr:uncharacterized protein LOC128671484 isoform X3 [Plodia interpunctella]
MPERPKRRKNNKNKRKNKNQRFDGIKNNSDVKTEDAESCSGEQTSLTEDINSITQSSDNLSETNIISFPSVSDENASVSDDAIIEHKVCFATENASQDLNNNSDVVEPLVVAASYSLDEHINIQEPEVYQVESPEQSLKPKSKRKKLKLDSVKSKSLDNDDAPQIVEITDSNAALSESDSNVSIIDTSNVVVSEVDTDVEWEKANEINSECTTGKEVATGTLSITTIPLNVAQCEQTKSLTPEEEISLRHYLQTLNLSTSPNVNSIEIKTEIEEIINREIKHRLRKKGLADDLFVQRLGPPRMLDVIDEEGSSESSIASRRQSYLSDKKSDNDDLEDDVFEDKSKPIEKYVTKSIGHISNKSYGRLVPQQCMLVGAKLQEPDVSEARGVWTMQTVEKMTGAEVVYLTDSSSSTSSIHDVGNETDDSVETDVSVRMITPTIEVTDTEKLLKETFVANSEDQVPNSIEEKSVIKKNEVNESRSDSRNQNNISEFYDNSHEIVVLSTDDIKTNLYVKDLDDSKINLSKDRDGETSSNKSLQGSKNEITTESNANVYNLEMKVLKCELNDAINNLIKEVSSDSDVPNENTKDNFTRQDSSSSVCSSQCTAKYNPTSSSLNDVSNILHDETCQNTDNSTKIVRNDNTTTHVKDVFECVTGTTANIDSQHRIIDQPLPLRDLCVKKISNLPYGLKILEELASVSERLQNINVYGLTSKEKERASKKENLKEKNMPYYPLPDLSSIEKVSLPSKSYEPLAPPVQPRNSSLKKSQDDNHWTALPSKSDPVYVCFSPSQKMLMEKTNTVITKEDATELIDTHKKFVDRRGYNEYYRENNKGHEHVTESPVVPFKSQTGSRLLALIRDPTVSYNINSSMNDHHFRNQNFGNLDKKSYMMNNRTDISSTFKPIPPPRPKKYSSSFYESDESSDFTDSSFRSMKSERKYFHYSTGNLSKEIENDVSSIQNMHRNFTDIRDSFNGSNFPRRPSLPKDICDKQMEYIRQKEKEVEAEIKRLEEEKNSMPVAPQRGPRAPLIKDKHNMVEQQYLYNQYRVDSKNICNNIQVPEKPVRSRLKSLFSSSEEELLRDKMYSEYVNQMAERQERKQHRIIKITNTGGDSKAKTVSKSMSALDVLDSKVNNRIEKEFISKARERWDKLGIKDPETEDEIESSKDVYREPKVIEHKIKVIEGNKETDVKKLPSHLQDFVRFTAKDKDDGRSSSAVWRPGAPTPPPAAAPAPAPVARSPGAPPPPPPPVWTPGSAGPSPQSTRKTFRPVHFEETPPTRRKFGNSEHNGCTSESESERRLRTSQSAPATGLNSLGTTGSSRLPRAQNPTVTLLQKAREGQIPRGSSYLQQERDSARLPRDRPSPPIGDPVHALRLGYASEGEAEIGARKMADAHARSKVEGIGPTTKDGMPVALRSEVKDPSRWYKKMYDTIHKNKYDDDYVTIRYKSRRGEPPQRVSNKSQYAYFDPRSGYLSEPEGGGRLGSGAWSDAYDSDVTSGARRRTASVQDDRRISDTSSPYLPNNKYSTLASARASQEVYKNQPGRIEDYVPGRSSVIDKEAKQWWDEVMDIFDGWLDDNSPLPPYTTLLARAIQKSQNISSTTSLPQASPKEKKDITSAILSKSNMARALKESGYESDSTLVFRRRDESAALSPAERRAAYRDLQAGGEPPLRGFRSPAPQRQECDSAPEPPRRATQGIYADKESPRRYVESDVNIHYRCPVRHDPLPLVPERELARQQAEHMKRLYREQKRNKYLQENEIHPLDIEAFDASIKELQDMQNRRHQDNFTPSQKNILPLNRYDEADRFVARALYAFNGQTARELSFRKGDLINVRRQIDANWYEGEVHGKIGLFPYNYVELMKGELAQSPKKPTVIEGRARAKFDFTAQTNLELPLKKGEVVVLTRRIDQNWWEGRNGGKTGIFPDSYVTVLQEPSPNKPEPQPTLSNDKPVASPAAHGLLNGSAKRSMGAHSYMPQPNNPALSNAPPATQPLPGYVAKPAQVTATPSERGYGPPTTPGVDLNNTEPLYVDTNAEAVPYRAMYKYRPQNPDELELNEGDTVYVLEKCDDGWYVGSSQRTGRFGTFPGNYVERI